MEDTMGPGQQRLNRRYKSKTLEVAKIGQSKESLSLQRKRWSGRHLDFISEAYCKEEISVVVIYVVCVASLWQL